MKKRIVALLLALVVLCTGVVMTACGGSDVPPETVAKKSTAELFNEAMARSNALNELSAVMEVEVEMAMDGFNMTIPLTIDIKGKDINSENLTLSMVMSMSMLGQEVKMETYQEGEWGYIVSGDMKYKAPAQALDNEHYTDSMLQVLPEEFLADVEPVTAEDGSQTVTVSLPGEEFSKIYNDLIQSMNSDTGLDTGEVKVSDAVVSITVADGYVTVCDLAFSMEMVDVEGTTATVGAKATITYRDPGQPVTITPPEGYQDFEEISLG